MKLFKKPQVLLILLFIGLFFWALNAEAEEKAFELGLAAGFYHSEQHITQRIGFNYADKWIAQYERHGGNGYDISNSISAQRQVVFRQGRKLEPYLRLGVSYFDVPVRDLDADEVRYLVHERLTFSLGAGVRLSKVMSLGFEHNSTAGRSDPNRGLDRFYLQFTMWL